jgi:hypothetical protein
MKNLLKSKRTFKKNSWKTLQMKLKKIWNWGSLLNYTRKNEKS